MRMATIEEHDRVVLTTDLAGEKLAAGDVGTVERREITRARRVA